MAKISPDSLRVDLRACFPKTLCAHDRRQKEAFGLWKGLILGHKWDALDLGGLDEIPVKWGGIADVGRRQTVTVADCEGLELAASDVDEDEEFTGF